MKAVLINEILSRLLRALSGTSKVFAPGNNDSFVQMDQPKVTRGDTCETKPRGSIPAGIEKTAIGSLTQSSVENPEKTGTGSAAAAVPRLDQISKALRISAKVFRILHPLRTTVSVHDLVS